MSLDLFTYTSLLLYRSLSEIGDPFKTQENSDCFVLQSGISNPYFNFILLKEQDPSTLEKIIDCFNSTPFEFTFPKENEYFIKACEKNGLSFGEETKWMELNVNDFQNLPLINESVSVIRVETEDHINKWINITSLGFRLSKTYIKAFFSPIFSAKHKHFHFFLCLYNNVPASALLMYINPPFSVVFSLVTQSKFRYMGLARDILQEGIMQAKKESITNCYVQASSLGTQLYKKIGFYQKNELLTYVSNDQII